MDVLKQKLNKLIEELSADKKEVIKNPLSHCGGDFLQVM